MTGKGWTKFFNRNSTLTYVFQKTYIFSLMREYLNISYFYFKNFRRAKIILKSVIWNEK
jgi:hypothetical protein